MYSRTIPFEKFKPAVIIASVLIVASALIASRGFTVWNRMSVELTIAAILAVPSSYYYPTTRRYSWPLLGIHVAGILVLAVIFEIK